MHTSGNVALCYFNPRSLTGATKILFCFARCFCISIHAPLRERPIEVMFIRQPLTFQSTLPCRSDIDARGGTRYTENSIHAPLRERQFGRTATSVAHVFQSTLPHGSDGSSPKHNNRIIVSIHAPLRERPQRKGLMVYPRPFQSTLPRGSDLPCLCKPGQSASNFNPRSLAGATPLFTSPASVTTGFQSTLPRGSDDVLTTILNAYGMISIHAPSRERLDSIVDSVNIWLFQSTLPRGSDWG